MTKADLTINDKSRLKDDIKLSLIIGLIFSVALAIIVGLIPLILFLLGKSPSHDFLTRGLFIIGLLFLPFLVVSWKNLLKYIELQNGKKLTLKVDDYEIINTKGKSFIINMDNTRQKVEIDQKLMKFIDLTQPLTVELSPLTNSLLFISHDSHNLLDKLDNDLN